MEEVKKRKRFRRPKKDETTGLVNPFINPTFQIPVARVKINSNLYKLRGESLESAEEEIEREHHKFIKIYTDVTIDEEDDEGNIVEPRYIKHKSCLRKDRSKLTPRAIHLLFWIAEEMKTGQDFVIINKARYMEEGDIGSVNTVKAAIKELQDKGFISSATVKDMYWINPMYMFKGSRTKKYPKNTVEVSKIIKE